MNNSIDTRISNPADSGSSRLHEAEALAPDAVDIEALAQQTQRSKAADGKAEEKAQVSISDVLKDPTSTAFTFMQKAQGCLARGDTSGYFAYHDHAMTWAQTEADARNA